MFTFASLKRILTKWVDWGNGWRRSKLLHGKHALSIPFQIWILSTCSQRPWVHTSHSFNCRGPKALKLLKSQVHIKALAPRLCDSQGQFPAVTKPGQDRKNDSTWESTLPTWRTCPQNSWHSCRTFWRLHDAPLPWLSLLHFGSILSSRLRALADSLFPPHSFSHKNVFY